jgi:hypothetical protein
MINNHTTFVESVKSFVKKDKTNETHKQIKKEIDPKDSEHKRPFWKRDWRK